ncbi:MAG: hypothetical protein RBS22_00350 [Spongiibacteraceae bacterium]|nr:hypothetical protein [Spongiibacteraceae bacterium]
MKGIRLSEAQARFVQGGVSIVISSRDRRRVPSLSRALACRVADNLRSMQVLLARSQSIQLLQDIETCGRVAVVFCQPFTHETYQIKSDDAQVLPAWDHAEADRMTHARAFADHVIPMGFSRDYGLVVHAARIEDCVAVGFTPQVLYAQTPGPDAGERIAPP